MFMIKKMFFSILAFLFVLLPPCSLAMDNDEYYILVCQKEYHGSIYDINQGNDGSLFALCSQLGTNKGSNQCAIVDSVPIDIEGRKSDISVLGIASSEIKEGSNIQSFVLDKLLFERLKYPHTPLQVMCTRMTVKALKRIKTSNEKNFKKGYVSTLDKYIEDLEKYGSETLPVLFWLYGSKTPRSGGNGENRKLKLTIYEHVSNF